MTRLPDTSRQRPSPDESFTIVDLTAESVVRERLLELGLAPGRTVQVLKICPFGGPIVVRAGSLSLALRRDEADHIWLGE